MHKALEHSDEKLCNTVLSPTRQNLSLQSSFEHYPHVRCAPLLFYFLNKLQSL